MDPLLKITPSDPDYTSPLLDEQVRQMIAQFQAQKKVQDAHMFLNQLFGTPQYSNYGQGTLDILSRLFQAGVQGGGKQEQNDYQKMIHEVS